jgi:hypothetical protein
VPSSSIDVVIEHAHAGLRPLGETFFEARLLAIVGALFLKSPGGGKVETVLTVATQRLPDLFPRADLAEGISLYQSELSISTIAAVETNCNTLMLVSEEKT